MTTEIEQRFFECFGIEKLPPCQWINSTCYEGSIKGCNDCRCGKYPKITAEKLLELICILSVINNFYKVPKIRTTDSLKYWILEICIKEEESIRTRVRKLFEEDNDARNI